MKTRVLLSGPMRRPWLSLPSLVVSVKAVLASTLFNLYFDVAIRIALKDGQLQVIGVKVAYLHDAKLVGNCRKLHLEIVVSNLKYAHDMALIAELWDDLKGMLDAVSVHCRDLGLTISCRKTTTQAVPPSDLYQRPESTNLFLNDVLV